jgi:NAD(P)-dependent dehydrogenase (short-subunit alcohol dehydrogenase family)
MGGIMSGRLEGKVTIITGGTSGIGERTAERFAREGAKVVIAGRSEAQGQAIAQRIGANAIYQRTDVTREEDIQALVQCTMDRFGRVDCLFNNAGAGGPVFSIEQVTAENIHQQMDLLLTSVLLATKAVVPYMKQQRSGSIINNASIGGVAGGFTPLLYSVAKAAVIHATRWVALELAEYRIRVNAISPIGIVTPVFARIFGVEGDEALAANETVRAWLAKGNPTGRAGEPDDIANVALFLASDESLLINGHNLVVDGGATVGRNIQDTLQRFGELTTALGVAGPQSAKGETPV